MGTGASKGEAAKSQEIEFSDDEDQFGPTTSTREVGERSQRPEGPRHQDNAADSHQSSTKKTLQKHQTLSNLQSRHQVMAILGFLKK